MEWISVKKRLPEKDCIEVAVLQRGIDPEVMTFFLPVPDEGIQGHRFYKSYRKHWDEMTDYVTHWMPLPEPPKK